MNDEADFLKLSAEPEEVSGPIETTEAEPERTRPTVTFMGNNYDLLAVVGVTIGGVMVLSCLTLNMAWYCLPFVPLVLGIVGLATVKDSVNPERTRLLSWLSVGSGGIILLLMFLCVVAYVGFIVFAVAMENGGGF